MENIEACCWVHLFRVGFVVFYLNFHIPTSINALWKCKQTEDFVAKFAENVKENHSDFDFDFHFDFGSQIHFQLELVECVEQ